MREQLTQVGRQISQRTHALIARARPGIEQARTWVALHGGRAWRAGVRANNWSVRHAKRGVVASLQTVENTMLNPRSRERVHAASVFALIFAFGLYSVDMLIAGGPELIPSAQASTSHAPRVDLIAATTMGGVEEIALAEADTAAPAIEPELAASIRPVRLAAADVPRDAAPVADLIDVAVEPVKASPAAPSDGAEADVKAGAEA